MRNNTLTSLTLSVFLASSATLLSGSATAGHFTIQVGAYKDLSREVLDKAESLGAVDTVRSGSITKVTVGEYSDRATASAALPAVQSAGFSDAFVRQVEHSDGSASASAKTPAHGAHAHGKDTHVHLPQAIEKRISELTEEQKSKVVLLDGKLHLKEGNTFTPL